MKKLLAILLAVAMLAAIGSTAVADGGTPNYAPITIDIGEDAFAFTGGTYKYPDADATENYVTYAYDGTSNRGVFTVYGTQPVTFIGSEGGVELPFPLEFAGTNFNIIWNASVSPAEGVTTSIIVSSEAAGFFTVGGGLTPGYIMGATVGIDSLSKNVDIIVNENGTVGTASDYGIAIFSRDDVIVNGGVVEATGVRGVAIVASGAVTVNGGTVRADNEYGVAIDTLGTVTVNDGTVETSGKYGAAIDARGVIVNGGAVSAEGEQCTAIRASHGDVTVNDGTVVATGNGGRAIYADGVTVKGGAVSAEGDGACAVGGDTVNVEGGTVSVKSTVNESGYTAAIFAMGSISVTGGIVSAEGPGVSAFDGYNLTTLEIGAGATVTAKGDGAKVFSDGVPEGVPEIAVGAEVSDDYKDYSPPIYFPPAIETEAPKTEEPKTEEPETPTEPEVPVLPVGPQTANPAMSKVIINGVEVEIASYNINDNNYYKLRDIAAALSGSDKQFEVFYNAATGTIELTSGKAYTAVGGELANSATESTTANPTDNKILLDGKEISLTAYNIGDNNYFKLRDIAEAFDIFIEWDEATGNITIDTTKGYTA